MRPPARFSLRVTDAFLVALPYPVLAKWARRGRRWMDKGYITDVAQLNEPDRVITIFRGRAEPRGRRLVDRTLIAFKRASGDGNGATDG